MTYKAPRYLVYKRDGERLSLIDDFASRKTSMYVGKSVPNLRAHVRTFGYCEGNGHRAVPYFPGPQEREG